MAYPLDQRYGLALKFAEFYLLPDLLALVPGSSGRGVPESWHDFLHGKNLNLDHVDEEDNQNPDELAADLAGDAWRLANGLELVSDDGLTTSGNALAGLADTPALERTEREDEFLERVLAEQILNCYLSGRLSLARLLQQAAERLEGTEWSEKCPGVLLIELQALIEMAHTNRESAPDFPNRFIEVRNEALRTYPLPQEDLEPLEMILGPEDARLFSERTAHADTVSYYYLKDLGLSGMTLTELRATAMLLTFAGLLELKFRLGPVQYLVLTPEM